MRVEIHNKDFQNWIKGVLALNTTRDALLDTLREKVGSFVSKYEKIDIQKFANCLESNHNIQLKTKKQSGKRRGKEEQQTYTCEHKQCKELFDVFVDKHKGIKKENFNWDLKINKENKDEENRVGENTNELELTEENTEPLWPILRLYMFDEGEHVAKYKGLDDLDISNLIKIMKNCAICEVDGDLELYEKVSTFRNEMMHSPHNKITMQYLQRKLNEAYSLIQHLSTGDLETCTSHRLEDAKQYLKNLEEKDFQFSSPLEEYQRVFQEVVKAKQIAEDLLAGEPNQEVLKHLLETLKTITQKEPTDISKTFVGRPSDFKMLVQNCIGKKKKALELDIALRSQEENAYYEIEQLQKLQREIKQDWNYINVELKKTEVEDLADLLEYLRKESTTFKAERDIAFQKNESLRRDIASKGQMKDIEVDRLNRQLREKELEVQLKELEINRLKRQLRQKELEVQLKEHEIDSLERQLREKKLEIEDLEERLLRLQKEKERVVERYGCRIS